MSRVTTARWAVLGWLVLAGLLAPVVGKVLRDRQAREVLRDQQERLDRGENADRSDSQVPPEPPVPSGRLDRQGRREWRDRQEWLATMESMERLARKDHQARKGFLAPPGPEGPPATELICPDGYTAESVIFNAPGGQLELYVCQRPAP